jgi:hypothetical protein
MDLVSLGPHRSAAIIIITGKVQISAETPACGPVVRKINVDTGNTRAKAKPLHQGRIDRLGAVNSRDAGGFLVRMDIFVCVAGFA